MTKKDKRSLIIGAVILVLFFFLTRTRGGAPDKTAASLARQIRQAFDPLNLGFISWNGTDTEGLYVLAAEITEWNKVRTEYKTLYGSDLVDDLSNELSASELNRFYTILNRK